MCVTVRVHQASCYSPSPAVSSGLVSARCCLNWSTWLLLPTASENSRSSCMVYRPPQRSWQHTYKHWCFVFWNLAFRCFDLLHNMRHTYAFVLWEVVLYVFLSMALHTSNGFMHRSLQLRVSVIFENKTLGLAHCTVLIYQNCSWLWAFLILWWCDDIMIWNLVIWFSGKSSNFLPPDVRF